MALRYALVISGEVKEERTYEAPPQIKEKDGKPLLRPIVEVTRPYNGFTQTYTISREVQNAQVVDTWVVTDLTEAEVKERALAVLKDHRQKVEYSGITIAGQRVPTDEKTCRVLGDMRFKAEKDANLIIENWTVGAVPRPLTAAEIIAVSDAVFAYAQKCFNAQAAVIPLLGSFSSPEQVIAAFDAAMAS